MGDVIKKIKHFLKKYSTKIGDPCIMAWNVVVKNEPIESTVMTDGVGGTGIVESTGTTVIMGQTAPLFVHDITPKRPEIEAGFLVGRSSTEPTRTIIQRTIIDEDTGVASVKTFEADGVTEVTDGAVISLERDYAPIVQDKYKDGRYYRMVTVMNDEDETESSVVWIDDTGAIVPAIIDAVDVESITTTGLHSQLVCDGEKTLEMVTTVNATGELVYKFFDMGVEVDAPAEYSYGECCCCEVSEVERKEGHGCFKDSGGNVIEIAYVYDFNSETFARTYIYGTVLYSESETVREGSIGGNIMNTNLVPTSCSNKTSTTAAIPSFNVVTIGSAHIESSGDHIGMVVDEVTHDGTNVTLERKIYLNDGTRIDFDNTIHAVVGTGI